MTQSIFYTKGWKYQLDEDITFKLHYDYSVKEPYSCQYYSIDTDNNLTIYRGCCWDGPTWFPDFKWMMRPSLIHDVLHWLIAKGVIHEVYNDLIDMELEHWIKKNKGMPRLYRFRGWYVRVATNRVNQRKGQIKKVYEA